MPPRTRGSGDECLTVYLVDFRLHLLCVGICGQIHHRAQLWNS